MKWYMNLIGQFFNNQTLKWKSKPSSKLTWTWLLKITLKEIQALTGAKLPSNSPNKNNKKSKK